MSSPVLMTTYRPDFYIVPSIVWDDESLTPLCVKLYGAIYWLSQLSKGKCTASNEFLAAFMRKDTKEQTVANMLTKLEARGYIKRVFSSSTKVERTEIIPLVKFNVKEPNQMVKGGSSDSYAVASPVGEQISNSNKEKRIIAETDKKSVLPIPETTPLKRLARFYSALYREQFDVKPVVKIAGKDGGIFKSLLKSWNEYQIAALLIVHFNWNGPFDTDEREFERLKANAFPLGWLTSAVNKYVVYLNDQEDVDMKDTDSVAKYVKEYVRGMGL